MLEAEITCLCSSIVLSDLGLTLCLGQTVHVLEEKAKRSQDLQRAVKAKGLRLKWVKRCREMRQEPSRQRPAKGSGRIMPVVSQPPPSEPDLVDVVGEIRGEITALRHDVRKLAEVRAVVSGPSVTEDNTEKVPVVPTKKRGPKAKENTAI